MKCNVSKQLWWEDDDDRVGLSRSCSWHRDCQGHHHKTKRKIKTSSEWVTFKNYLGSQKMHGGGHRKHDCPRAHAHAHLYSIRTSPNQGGGLKYTGLQHAKTSDSVCIQPLKQGFRFTKGGSYHFKGHFTAGSGIKHGLSQEYGTAGWKLGNRVAWSTGAPRYLGNRHTTFHGFGPVKRGRIHYNFVVSTKPGDVMTFFTQAPTGHILWIHSGEVKVHGY